MQKISAQSLSLAHDGTLWAGTAEGLWHRVGDHWVRYTREQGLPNDLVETVREDHEGALWFSTAAGGVGRLSGSAMENWRERDGFVESITFVIEETTGVDSLERVLWFGHESGLVLRRHHRFVRFGPQNGVPPGVTGVLDDERGQIWIHSSSGIFHAPKQQFFAVAEGRQSRVQLKEFGTRSEIGALKPSVAFRKSAIRGTDGLLWFNTISGVIAVDPTWEIHNTVPPPVMVDSVFKDRSGVDQTSVVIVPASVQTLEIRYAGLSFVTPERVYFRYKLDGYDRTWIEAGTRRTAFYTHLPPGQYRFEVLATNNEGVWSQTSAFQQIRIEPQWHQTWWWYTVCATLFGLAIWQIQQLRVRHIRSRFALVLSERTRIARELHDTLLQGFAGISWQLEGVSRSLFSAPEESKRQLDQLLEEVDRCLREARHTISYMRLPALTDNRLAAALLQAGEQLTAQTRTQFSLRVIGVPSSWPYTVESNLFLVGREAITNAVAHAQAREIRVELQYGEDGLRLSIHDNGCGFDPEDPALGQNEHWGLVGMRERVNQVGGNLSLRSVLGQGTCIEILLPPIPATARMQRRSDRETVKK